MPWSPVNETGRPKQEILAGTLIGYPPNFGSGKNQHMKNRTQLLLLVLATITGWASGSACETLYHGGGCEQCMSAGSYCNYCPKDNKCSNSDLKKYCGCSSTDCYGQDCAVKTCPQKPTPPPTPKPKAAKFVITVEEITNALNHSHEGHPLENLVISKILGKDIFIHKV